MKVLQIHLFNLDTGGIEVFTTESIPVKENMRYKLFAIYLEDGSTISC